MDGSLYGLYVDGNMKDYYYNFAGVMTLHLTLVLWCFSVISNHAMRQSENLQKQRVLEVVVATDHCSLFISS